MMGWPPAVEEGVSCWSPSLQGERGKSAPILHQVERFNANSERAEQGAWYQELRALLAADPEWFNGTLAREVVG